MEFRGKQVLFGDSQAECHNAAQGRPCRALKVSFEALSEAKARFLAATGHDLRQPLQGVRLFLETLDHRLTDPHDRKILAGALHALSASEDLLHRYLDASVIASGQIPTTPVPVEVPNLLTDLELELAPAAIAMGLKLRIRPVPLTIVSDPVLLRQMLRNLIRNAIRYTHSGGVMVGCRRRGQSLRIEVWDTGIGIPGDKLATIFEDFYQLHNPERDRAKGLGLGLSLVQHAACQLGHPLSVESRPGKGSVFAITVPLSSAKAQRQAAA